MGNNSLYTIAVFLFVAILVLVDAKPALNPIKQSPEDLKLIYQSLQRQLDEENAAFQNALDASHRLQYGTIKTRRAPSPDGGYEWEGMMQALDNLRKPSDSCNNEFDKAKITCTRSGC